MGSLFDLDGAAQSSIAYTTLKSGANPKSPLIMSMARMYTCKHGPRNWRETIKQGSAAWLVPRTGHQTVKIIIMLQHLVPQKRHY